MQLFFSIFSFSQNKIKRGRFCVYFLIMAEASTSIAENICELFADTDSENEEFEGFTENDFAEDDLNIDNVSERDDLFDIDNWVMGEKNPELLPFTQTPGIKCDLPDNASVSDYFYLYVNENDFENISEETNRYAKQYLDKNNNLSRFSRFRKWTNTTATEMKRFIAVVFAMGILSQSDVTDYWSKNPVTSTPFFPSTMPRDRFLLMSSFFHLANNDEYVARGQPNYNPLFKLGTFYGRIVNRFHSVYTPGQSISLDEGMIPWRGNLSFRVYSPDKPVKYGIKAYMISDSSNGYVSKFKLYTGKSGIGPSSNGATYDLVMDMLRGMYEKGYNLYCDNYYTSPQLFWDLYGLGVGATGTVRSNRRGIPQFLKDKKLTNKGDLSVMSNGPLNCVKFLDGKAVFMLSTIHKTNLVNTRRRDRETNDYIRKPSVVNYYNKYMGGVDRSDQMITYINSVVKSFKWWKKVIFHVLAIAVLDAYTLYKADHPNITHKAFRRQLITELVSNNPIESDKVGRPSNAKLERLSERHFISRIVGVGKKKNIARLCKVCNEAEKNNVNMNNLQKRKRPGHETCYECRECNVSLCIEPCFKIWHTQKEYVVAYKRWKNSSVQPVDEE
ncbi:piggyBac transposable element-derived protein 4-like [Mytilus edulis]